MAGFVTLSFANTKTDGSFDISNQIQADSTAFSILKFGIPKASWEDLPKPSDPSVSSVFQFFFKISAWICDCVFLDPSGWRATSRSCLDPLRWLSRSVRDFCQPRSPHTEAGQQNRSVRHVRSYLRPVRSFLEVLESQKWVVHLEKGLAGHNLYTPLNCTITNHIIECINNKKISKLFAFYIY